jgi:AcrR family transcriptional regulator
LFKFAGDKTDNMKTTNEPDVKERVLRAARELFVKNGYDGTSVRDIAAASGTNVAHVTYYFRSKYNLFEIIFEEAFDVLLARLKPVLVSDMPFFELVETWIDTYYEILSEYPQIPVFVLNEINHNYQGGLVELIKSRAPGQVLRAICTRVEEEARRGTIKAIPPVSFVFNMVALSIFPFAFGPLVTRVAGLSMPEYREIVQRHKPVVKRFVLDALRP